MDNMHVFSGLCWANGTFTAFLDEMLAGFATVNFFWESECSYQIEPFIHACQLETINPLKDMEDGPNEYKRIIIERQMCISDGFDDGDVSSCGNVDSLKRLAHIMELFFTVGPGVTFQLSDFELQ
ncbi:uncharacterized protein LOC132559978 [Ylistrum balloti]|uniref:uncharacterized protein LOC132559978 n=1 Tax=Ylistrum balloti TaxID=509963 RepID=UPI002905D76C|nr:uncharacterized protein LOC132559978 [Ylistrum balloti]